MTTKENFRTSVFSHEIVRISLDVELRLFEQKSKKTIIVYSCCHG
jgi:hypothetical protein